MSEKRHRQQQRRRRRKAAGRTRPGTPTGRRTQAPEQELAALVRRMAVLSVGDMREVTTPLEAEQWASDLIGTCRVGPIPEPAFDASFFARFVDALEQLGTAEALAGLRALAAVGAPDYADGARAAAERLAGRGLDDPPWAAALGRLRATAAALMSDEAFDDGLNVMIEFASPGYETHTVSVYIDHNLGGLVKDAFLGRPLAELRDEIDSAEAAALAVRDLDLAEARARVAAALDMLDHTYDPPVDEDVWSLRALIEARIRALPGGFELPDAYEELEPAARDALIEDFLSAPEGRRWDADEDAEDVAYLAVEFGAGYNHGGPLRWSPVVVEIFMTSWLARKVAREPEFFERVPEVLRDWVSYAGRRRGVPADRLRDAIAAVDDCRADMLEAVEDPAAWGPAKALLAAALGAGVDVSDADDLQRFVQRYNDGLAA